MTRGRPSLYFYTYARARNLICDLASGTSGARRLDRRSSLGYVFFSRASSSQFYLSAPPVYTVVRRLVRLEPLELLEHLLEVGDGEREDDGARRRGSEAPREASPPPPPRVRALLGSSSFPSSSAAASRYSFRPPARRRGARDDRSAATVGTLRRGTASGSFVRTHQRPRRPRADDLRGRPL